MMIAIIDYGMGNLFSVQKALLKLGCKVVITSNHKEIMAAKKIVLPGVGAFGKGIENLEKSGLSELIKQAVAADIPLLGICLGLQLLFEGSDEAPGVKGLSVFKGKVRKIPALGQKIPHIGWNSLSYSTKSPLFDNIKAGQHVYFVHSYHAEPEVLELVTATTDYGCVITAAVGCGKLQAVQFHPEKSGEIGLKILANFKELKA